jgi:hypothetical protein
MKYNPADYYIDFSSRTDLTDSEKTALERIQQTYLPIERATFLQDYRYQGKITDDDYEKMTGIPYRYE